MIYALTLTWNGLDKIKRLAKSFENVAAETNEDIVWAIRDNGSTDGTSEWLDFISGPVDHLENYDILNTKILSVSHNRDNFAQGVNSLVEFVNPSDEDYILLLNNDIIFDDKKSLQYMLDLMNDPKIGVVGARLLYKGTNRLQHAGVIFGPRYGNMPFHYRWKEESDKQSEKNRYFQAVTAACCLVRAKDMVKMDEKFNWAFEDVDMCLRIGNKKKIAYCGKTKIFHEESGTLKKNPVNNLFLMQNVRRFKEKWFGKYTLDHEKYLKRSNYMTI